jgi:hypothetical protein
MGDENLSLSRIELMGKELIHQPPSSSPLSGDEEIAHQVSGIRAAFGVRS